MRGRVILAVATPLEAAAVLRGLKRGDLPVPAEWRPQDVGGGFELLITGVGKSNAAGAVGRLLDVSRHSAVLTLGVAGSLGPAGPGIASLVLATACIYADEGIETPEGFADCAIMGFPLGPFPGSAAPVDAGLLAALKPASVLAAPIATVSTCSGTDARAAEVFGRTGAAAEGMEGAAAVHIAARMGVPAAELRAISNTTGDRTRQVWDIRAALAALSGVIGRF